MWNACRQFQPRPRWFIVAPVLAVLIIVGPMALPSLVFCVRGGLILFAPHVAIVVLAEPLLTGLLYFRLGLWGLFIRNLGLYHQYWGIFSYAGWSILLVQIAAGLQFPRRQLFILLVILLLLNIIGFPQALMTQGVKNSLVW